MPLFPGYRVRDIAGVQDHPAAVPLEILHTVPMPPSSPPRETRTSQSSSPERAQAADIPKTECPALTSRLRGTDRTHAVQPQRSEPALRAHSQGRRRSQPPVHSQVTEKDR